MPNLPRSCGPTRLRLAVLVLALSASPALADTPVVFRAIPQNAFSVGEKITLSVRYMGIPCGDLVLSVSEMTTYRGRPVYVLHAHAYTNRAFSMFYSISDTLTSYLDVEGLFSWKYIKEIHETRDDKVEVYEYDQGAGKWSRDGVVMGDILPFTQDLLSTIYYLRGVEWKEGADTIRAPLNDTKKNYDMSFELGQNKRLNVQSKWVTTRSGRPNVQLDGKYKMIGANEVWFTDDARRIPALVRCNIRLGNLYGKLVEYEPGGKPVADNTPEAPR